MAYDPNDPADVAIVTAAVDKALKEAKDEHEAEIAGLKKKRDELLGKISDLRANGGADNKAEVSRLEAEVNRLEGEVTEANKKLKLAEKSAETATTERDAAVQRADTEAGVSRKLLVDGGLTNALVAANVDAKFLPAATALLKDKVVIKEVNGERQAFVGDKPLGEFVKEWSQGDDGKHYVSAPGNGGAGAGGGSKGAGGKELSEMGDAERREWAERDPLGFKAAVDADKKAKGQT